MESVKDIRSAIKYWKEGFKKGVVTEEKLKEVMKLLEEDLKHAQINKYYF